MALITYLTVPEKDSDTTVELNKLDLLALTEISSDAYWGVGTNISKVTILMISTEGGQKKFLNFDFTQATPQQVLSFSDKARDDFQIRGIKLTDFDGGNFIIGRATASAGTISELTALDISLIAQDLLISAQQAYVKASNTDNSDKFGYATTLSSDGNTLAVGAPEESSNATGINGIQSNNSSSQSGAVYVFTKSGSTWSQQAYIKASNTGDSDRFGSTVAISGDGNTLAVGATWESSNATGINGDQSNNSSFASGAVYVFTRTGSTWSQQAYIKASDTTSNSYFGGGNTTSFNQGIAISDDGDTLAVGAWGNAYGVYVFTRTGSTWSQQQKLIGSNIAGSSPGFAQDLAISGDGNTIAVGADGEDSNATGINGNPNLGTLTDSGAVYVFTRSGSVWTEEAYVKASNTGASDRFGTSLALSSDGTTLAVGATGEASNATGINGNQSDNSISSAGAVYLFTRSGTTWSQQAYIKASNTGTTFDIFGNALAMSLSGNTLLVAARQEDSNATGINGNQSDNSISSAGAVYLFTRSGTTWSQQAYIKASVATTSLFFGMSLSISGDAGTVVVGASGEKSSTTGINSTPNSFLVNAGAAYIFSA